MFSCFPERETILKNIIDHIKSKISKEDFVKLCSQKNIHKQTVQYNLFWFRYRIVLPYLEIENIPAYCHGSARNKLTTKQWEEFTEQIELDKLEEIS